MCRNLCYASPGCKQPTDWLSSTTTHPKQPSPLSMLTENWTQNTLPFSSPWIQARSQQLTQVQDGLCYVVLSVLISYHRDELLNNDYQDQFNIMFDTVAYSLTYFERPMTGVPISYPLQRNKSGSMTSLGYTRQFPGKYICLDTNNCTLACLLQVAIASFRGLLKS